MFSDTEYITKGKFPMVVKDVYPGCSMLADQTQSLEGFIKIVFALFVFYCCIIRRLLQMSI